MKIVKPLYGEIHPITPRETIGLLLRETNKVSPTDLFDDLLVALDQIPAVK